jgi:dTDP-L-rhamnose 4-epimerase
MKILITGGRGFIGQEIAKLHIECGDEVYLYDLKVNPYVDYNKPYFGIDLTENSLQMILLQHTFDIISHQGAVVGVGESQYQIQKYFHYNVEGTAELLQAILNSKKLPNKILFAGSMGPYGEGAYKKENGRFVPIPTKENFKLDPKSIYALTKKMQEELLSAFAQIYNVSVISLRYFSVYSDTFPPLNPLTGVLSIIGNKIINGKAIELYEDGEQTRDLVHSYDVARAHYLACHCTLTRSVPLLPINIGTGKNYSMNYIAKKMKEYLHSDKEIVHTHTHRFGDIKNMIADNTYAKVWLGWEPTINLEDSIKSYCEFLKEHWDEFTINKDTTEIEAENLKNRGLVK